jgi:hypothetical protein
MELSLDFCIDIVGLLEEAEHTIVADIAMNAPLYASIERIR